MTTASEAQEAQSYWVAVASPSTWTPALPPAAAGGVTRFRYDGDGGRVQQTTPAGLTTFLGELYEVSGSAQTKHLFAGALRIAALSHEGIAYLHSDHLGSSHVTTDARGAGEGDCATGGGIDT